MFEQDRVLLRLQQRVLAEPEVLVCFLSGSYGRGEQDAFSDLDVAMVFADEDSRETAFEQRRDFVRSVLPYVPAKSFDAAHVRPYFHIAL
jgi:signal-transduction protein with cAMP-binding, CBS, and nucleotidyltransferase domain